ncbi:DNA transposase [Frankliniella fusca]|uniref:DNA transposase n=1 Tax=Frankliniella fusca TaxID=407009 RepID=A0AAE1HG86_9NEOP|nr:DNA transposase [Frankliniella fusca]
MFVHNREVPRDNFVWNSVAQISENDLQDNSVISEYLPKLCCVVQSSRICKGVRLYNDQWARGLEENRGFVESECYVEAACFRDKNCPLLVTDTDICIPCKKLLNLLKCRSWRASHEKDKDVKKINIKYLTGEAAKERLRETQEEKRKLVKKLFKYRERLRAYIEKYTVPVSTELGTDIAKIFKENEDSMSPVQKLFWSEQLKSLATQKNPRQMRWNPFIIRLALHLQMLSNTAYEYVRLFIHLPSKRTLFDYSHFIDAKEGPQEFIMQDLSRKCMEECLNKHEKYFNLIFDEVDIRSGIVISKRTGDIVGYVKLSDVEEELVQLEAEISEKAEPRKQIAKKLLVYMATGITNSLIGIVGVFTTGGNFTAGQIYTRTWNVIYRLENLGMKVLCLTSDGASVNKKFFKMHFDADPTSKYIYKTKNIACGEDRPLFFITDPVHVLKSLRNNFSNSFSHKKTREMWKDSESLSWLVIENLFYLTKGQKYVDLKLTKSHIKLTSHSCMKVIYAAQVMSLSVARAISYYEEELKSKRLSVNQVKMFIQLVNNWFDCLNGSSDPKGKRIKENDNLLPYSDPNDARFTFLLENFLSFFDEWYRCVMERPGKFTKDRREKMFISMLTYESLHTTTHSFVSVIKFLLAEGAPEINARKLNQDKLEQFFGVLRMSFGGNRNPTTYEAVQKIIVSYQQGNAARPPSKGSTEASKDWEPEEAPLRKRPRKY